MVVSMKIKNKLVLAFVSVAFIPVSLVAVISVMNTRTQAVDQFIDGSTREIRQIDGNIRQFFDGTLQNVDQMATDSVYTSLNTLKNYQPAEAASQPMTAETQAVIERFARLITQATDDDASAPEVDLLIRTGGEKRLSDFLLWECAYAELLFTDKMWPEFGTDDLRSAVSDFRRRERRFGGLRNIAAEPRIAGA